MLRATKILSLLVFKLLILLSFSAFSAIPLNEDFDSGGFNDPALFGGGTSFQFINGRMRLTDNSGNQIGGMVLTDPFPSTTDLVIEFDYYMYGGSGADGISFFLADGAAATSIGDFGGCLGYCTRDSGVTPGVLDGYVGIGIDAFGNFSDSSHSPDPLGIGGVLPDHIAIRGSGDAVGSGQYNLLQTVPVAGGVETTSTTPHTVRITIIGDLFTLELDTGGGFNTLINSYDLSTAIGQAAKPSTFKLGFGASTGGSTNFHELDNLRVDVATDLQLVKSGSTNVASGGSISYTLTMTNAGPADVNNAIVTDTIPAAITGVTWTCAATGTSACNTGGGSGNNLSEDIDLDVGDTVTITINGTVNPSTTIGTVLSNTASITLPSGLADVNSADNTDTLNTLVDGAAVSISATTNGAEPTTDGQFTVSIAQTVPQDVTVNYNVLGSSSAVAGTDYTALSGSVVIPANSSSATIDVPVINDFIIETTDSLDLQLSGLSSVFGGTLEIVASPGDTASIDITDDDVISLLSIAGTTNGSEPGTNGQFTVSISQSVNVDVTINYTVLVSSTATAGSDYTTLSGSVLLPANATSTTIDVLVLDDSDVEGSETVDLQITGFTSTYPGTIQIDGSNDTDSISIADDELIVAMTVPDNSGDICTDTGSVTVTITDGGGLPVSGVVVSFAVTGSATLGTALGVTNASGQITTTVSNTVVEVVDVTAQFDSTGDNNPDAAVTSGSPGQVTFVNAVCGGGSGNLIHAWYMEDDWTSGNEADFVGTLDATPTDGPTNQTANPALPEIAGQGTCGYGSFDGTNDNLEFGDDGDIDLSGDLTLAAWVNTDQNTGYRYVISLGQSGSGGNRREVYLGMRNGNWSAGSRVGGAVDRAEHGIAGGEVNSWVHIAGVFDASAGEWELYVDGVLEDTQATAVLPPNFPSTAYWSIGGRSNNNGGNRNFNGDIDEVRIFDDALTQTEVQALMTERHPCPATPTLTVIKSITVIDDNFSVTNDKAIPGATLRYTITLINSGGDDIDNVDVVDDFDDTAVEFIANSVSISLPGGTDSGLGDGDVGGFTGANVNLFDLGGVGGEDDRVRVDQFDIPDGQTATVTFDVRVD